MTDRKDRKSVIEPHGRYTAELVDPNGHRCTVTESTERRLAEHVARKLAAGWRSAS